MKTTRERIEDEERAERPNYQPGPYSDIGKPCVFAVRDTYLSAAERLIEAGDARELALREANTTMEQARLSASDKIAGLEERVLSLKSENALLVLILREKVAGMENAAVMQFVFGLLHQGNSRLTSVPIILAGLRAALIADGSMLPR